MVSISICRLVLLEPPVSPGYLACNAKFAFLNITACAAVICNPPHATMHVGSFHCFSGRPSSRGRLRCAAGFCLAFAALCWGALLPFWAVLLLIPATFLIGLQLVLKGAPLLPPSSSNRTSTGRSCRGCSRNAGAH